MVKKCFAKTRAIFHDVSATMLRQYFMLNVANIGEDIFNIIIIGKIFLQQGFFLFHW